MSVSQKDRENAQDVYYLPSGVDPETMEPTEEEKEFREFQAQMHDADSEATITVGKKRTDNQGRPVGRKLFQCFECAIDDYTFPQLCARIRDEFGTGLYKIQGRGSDGTFKFGKTVGVEAPKSDEKNNDGTNVGMLIDKFSYALERHQDRTERMIREFSGPQTGGDAFDQMTKMMAAMGGMMGAIGLKPPQPPAPPKTIIEQITEYKLLQEFMENGNSGNSGNDNFYSMMTATIQNIGPLLAGAMEQGKENGRINDDGKIGPKMIEAPHAEKQPEAEGFKEYIVMLVEQAKLGANPLDVVDFLLPQLPEETLEPIEDFLIKENAIELCIAMVPDVAQHREWFISWRDLMLRDLAEILQESEDLTTAPVQAQNSVTSVAGESQTDEQTIAPAIETKSDINVNESPTGGGRD